MHYPMRMHNLQSLKDAFHDHLDFCRRELVAVFDLVVELSTLKQLHRDVNGVLAFEDTV